MKLFLDTANIEDIRKALSLGIIDGVTTNPTLIAKEKVDLKKTIREICHMVNGPVSGEVTGLNTDEMVKQGRELSLIHPNVVVKIPMNKEGLKAVKLLSQEGIRTNVTLIFSAQQGLLAAKAGATYVSPFIGRLDDTGNGGLPVIGDLVDILRNYHYSTEVICASIRSGIHVLQCAKVGASIATVPYKVLMDMINHPLTDVGIEKFMADAKKI